VGQTKKARALLIIELVRFEDIGAPTSPRQVPCSDPELPSFQICLKFEIPITRVLNFI